MGSRDNVEDEGSRGVDLRTGGTSSPHPSCICGYLVPADEEATAACISLSASDGDVSTCGNRRVL